MHILGISCFYHDAAAALLQDGHLVAAAQEERFTRVKHDPSFPTHAIDFCLRRAGIRAEDLDYVVFYEKPFLKFERLMFSILSTFPRSARLFREAMHNWFGEKLWVKARIQESLGVDAKQILFSEHHLSHAASAFFCSPFEEAAILTVDGVGEWTTASFGRGTADWTGRARSSIDLSQEIRFPHSLGLLYSVLTAFLGFEVNEGEYKVMGMAPYGEPRYVDKLSKLIDIETDGSFHLDMSYFSYQYHSTRAFTPKLEALLGTPRDPQARFVTSKTSLFDDPNPPTRAELERNQFYADVAASIQHITEEVMLKMAHHLQRTTGLTKLCIAGGVGLNSVANYKILQTTGFDEIYIQPAAGDAGGALGAALYAYHVLLGQPRRFVMDHAYWGRQYSGAEIADTLCGQGARYEQIDDDEKLMDRLIERLAAGAVAGWYQGPFEWGPRALGNRSILADARQAQMKDIVNIKIKFREAFRPFAPSVLVEHTERLFELPNAKHHYPARFMLYVAPVKRPDLIPAITHVDGTGRLQTVHREANPRYYRLIEKFGEATGVPVLLNTSFNLKGDAIVSSPAEALGTFRRCGMDLLVMDNFLVTK